MCDLLYTKYRFLYHYCCMCDLLYIIAVLCSFLVLKSFHIVILFCTFYMRMCSYPSLSFKRSGGSTTNKQKICRYCWPSLLTILPSSSQIIAYRACLKSNVSEWNKNNFLIRSVQHIKGFQNTLLLRQYIASSEISRHRRRHSRPFAECLLEPWCKPL